LEAIREGIWNFEPDVIDDSRFESTQAMPGTHEKVHVLAKRLERGLPLWNSGDRMSYDEE
jgi:hypothetical protein